MTPGLTNYLYYHPNKESKLTIGGKYSDLVCELAPQIADETVPADVMRVETLSGKIWLFLQVEGWDAVKTVQSKVPNNDSDYFGQTNLWAPRPNRVDPGNHANPHIARVLEESCSVWFGKYIPDTNNQQGEYLLTYRLDVTIDKIVLDRMRADHEKKIKKGQAEGEAANDREAAWSRSIFGTLCYHLWNKHLPPKIKASWEKEPGTYALLVRYIASKLPSKNPDKQ